MARLPSHCHDANVAGSPDPSYPKAPSNRPDVPKLAKALAKAHLAGNVKAVLFLSDAYETAMGEVRTQVVMARIEADDSPCGCAFFDVQLMTDAEVLKEYDEGD